MKDQPRDPAVSASPGPTGGEVRSTVDRRDPRTQRRIPGGLRATDPPLTTRACADWMGVTPEWVRGAITSGVTVRGVRVQLEAETLTINRRRIYRIHLDRFIAFLRAVEWKRIPRSLADGAAIQGN